MGWTQPTTLTRKTVTITIRGLDEPILNLPPPNIPAEIGGTTSGQVTENGVTTASGALTIADANPGEDAFQPETGLAGSFGMLSIDAAGAWSYMLDPSAPELATLDTGETLTDTLTVRSVDGTEQAITIRIAGDGTSGGGGGGASPGSFLGKPLEYLYLFPDLGTVWDGSSFPLVTKSVFTVGAGVELIDPSVYQIDVGDTDIRITFSKPTSWTDGFAFNGIRFSDVADNLREITGASVSVSGFSSGPAPMISSDANTIFLEWGGLQLGAGATVTVNVTFAPTGNDPIVLDLGGDGFEFRERAEFDLDDDGQAEAIGWVGGGDGLLAIDLDGSGAIESGRELISERFDGIAWESSMAALRALDGNGEGVLDSADPLFADILVWRDNGDAWSVPSELDTLDAFWIRSLDLDAEPQSREVDGQSLLALGQAGTLAGDTLHYAAVAFAPVADEADPEDVFHW